MLPRASATASRTTALTDAAARAAVVEATTCMPSDTMTYVVKATPPTTSTAKSTETTSSHPLSDQLRIYVLEKK